MREANLFQELNLRTSSDPNASCCPFSDTIDGQYCSLLKRGAEEGARSVREVVLAEENLRRGYTEPFLNQVLDPELVTKPGDHRLPEDPVRAGKSLHAR